MSHPGRRDSSPSGKEQEHPQSPHGRHFSLRCPIRIPYQMNDQAGGNGLLASTYAPQMRSGHDMHMRHGSHMCRCTQIRRRSRFATRQDLGASGVFNSIVGTAPNHGLPPPCWHCAMQLGIQIAFVLYMYEWARQFGYAMRGQEQESQEHVSMGGNAYPLPNGPPPMTSHLSGGVSLQGGPVHPALGRPFSADPETAADEQLIPRGDGSVEGPAFIDDSDKVSENNPKLGGRLSDKGTKKLNIFRGIWNMLVKKIASHSRNGTNKCKVRKSFPCANCGAQFPTKHSLQNHTAITHIEHHRFTCEECQKKCSRKGNLKVHVDIRHRQKRSVRCEHCSKVFATKKHLGKHHKSVHRDLFQNSKRNVHFVMRNNKGGKRRTDHAVAGTGGLSTGTN